MNAAALMDTRVNSRCACSRRLSVSDHYLRLFIAGVIFAIIVTVARAAEELPAVTVTGRPTPNSTPPGDTVSRDWAERSPEVNWPTPMFNKAAEIFTHNQIVINASCETVWNHLVHAELWPYWCPYSGRSRFRVDRRCYKRIRDLPGPVPTSLKRLELSREFRPIEWTAWSLNALLLTAWAGAVSGGSGRFTGLWFLRTIIGTLSRWD